MFLKHSLVIVFALLPESGIVADVCTSENSSDTSSGVHSSETSEQSPAGGKVSESSDPTILSHPLVTGPHCEKSTAVEKQMDVDLIAETQPPKSLRTSTPFDNFLACSAKTRVKDSIQSDDSPVQAPSDELSNISLNTTYVKCMHENCTCSGSCSIPMTEVGFADRN